MQLLIEVAGILKRRGLYSLLRFSQMLQNGQCFTVSVDNDPKHTVKKCNPRVFQARKWDILIANSPNLSPTEYA